MESLKKWWSLLEKEGKKFGYNVNAKKSYLIVKEQYKDKAKEIFEDTNIKISTEGHQHLGSVIESKQFSESYISSLINQWCEEISESSSIAKTHTQAGYSAFTSGYKHKFTFFTRTIENIENFMLHLGWLAHLVSQFACNKMVIVDASSNPPVSNIKLL